MRRLKKYNIKNPGFPARCRRNGGPATVQHLRGIAHENNESRGLIDAGYAKLLADPFRKELQDKYGVYPLE